MKLKTYCAMSNQGPYLNVNEDNLEVDTSLNLFVLLDGIGGSQVGDECARQVKETIRKFYTKIGGDPNSTLPFYYNHKYLLEGNALINSMHYAHSVIVKQNREKQISQRAASSCLAAACSEHILTVASAGNIMGLLYRLGELYPFVLPDSINSGLTSEYEGHFQTTPINGIGLFEELYLNTKEIKVHDEDLFIFLTDGAYSRIKNHELKHIIQQKDLLQEEKIQEIFDLVNSRDNLDNQSAIFLQF
jgi:serine/threonine protein phosphatase PrpC